MIEFKDKKGIIHTLRVERIVEVIQKVGAWTKLRIDTGGKVEEIELDSYAEQAVRKYLDTYEGIQK